jgi:hypothetical protein
MEMQRVKHRQQVADEMARERKEKWKKKRAEYMKQYKKRSTLQERKEFSDSSDND